MSEAVNQVVLSFLDRMIDESAKTTEALTTLRDNIKEQRDQLEKINNHFSNGFRSDIKEHITVEAGEVKDSVQETRHLVQQVILRIESEEEKRQRLESYKKMDDFLDMVKNPKTYITVLASVIIALTTLVSGVFFAAIKIEPYISHFLSLDKNTQQNIPQKTP